MVSPSKPWHAPAIPLGNVWNNSNDYTVARENGFRTVVSHASAPAIYTSAASLLSD